MFIVNKIHPLYLLTARPSTQPKAVIDSSCKLNIWSLGRRQLLLAMVGLSILIVRWQLMGAAPPVFQVIDNPHSFVNGTFLRVGAVLLLVTDWRVMERSIIVLQIC